MRYRFIFPAIALVAAGIVACNDNPEPEYPQGGYGAQAPYPQSGYGAQAPVPAPTATQAPPSSSATQIPPAMATFASPLLKELATRETAGMREDGPAVAGQFQQGQVLEQPFQVQPGRCYAVVGVGIGITELDFEIVVHQPPAPEWVAAQDNTSGPQAVLGGNGQCFKNPLPVGAPAVLRIRATGGGGVALAQIYSR